MKKLVTFAIVVIITACFLPENKAWARSVSIPSVHIVATIKADGTVDIEEHRTIEFQGSFTEGFYELQKTGYTSLQNFSLSDDEGEYTESPSVDNKNRTYHRTETERTIKIDYFYQAQDIQKTFVFRYQLDGIINLYDDFGQFYWQLQGNGWDFVIHSFDAEIRWESPIPVETYRIWAYGPLWGEALRVDNHHAIIRVASVPENTFVEVRLLLPSSYFSMDQTHSGSLLEQILDQEIKEAQEANRLRDEAKKQSLIQENIRQNRKIIGKTVMLGMTILALMLLLLYLFLYFFYGKEYSAPKQPIYYREPPSSLRPALVGLLCNMNRWEEKFLQATMLDLMRRKRIKYETITDNSNNKHQKDKRLTLVENDKDSLADYEFILLYRIIFDVKKSITLKDLNKQLRESHDHFKRILQEFKNSLQKEMTALGYFDKSSRDQSLFALILGVIITLVGPIVFSILSVFFMGQVQWGFFVIWPIGLLYWLGCKALQRRSKEGIEEYVKWKSFRSFLKDFTNLQEYAPNSLIIWERFLVYATALGIAHLVLKTLRLMIPNLIDKNKGTFLTPSLFAHDTVPTMRDLQGAVRGISSVTDSVHRVAHSSYSSGTGTGGGFSSGGGGGGGGSGGGFR